MVELGVNQMFGGLSALGKMVMSTVLIIILVIAVSGMIIAIVYFMRKAKRFNQFIVRIWERDGAGNLVELPSDQGGIFVDGRTKFKLLFLRRNRVGMNPSNIPYVLKTNGKKVVNLFKKGEKSFSYMRMVPNVSHFDLQVEEEDVNHAIQDYERDKKILLNGFWEKYKDMIAFGMFIFVVLILFIFLFQQFHQFVSMAQEFAKGAEATRETVKVLSRLWELQYNARLNLPVSINSSISVLP